MHLSKALRQLAVIDAKVTEEQLVFEICQCSLFNTPPMNAYAIKANSLRDMHVQKLHH